MVIKRSKKTCNQDCIYPLFPKNNSAQLKIQQMLFMLLAVGFLFALVGMVFISVSFKSLKASATALGEKNAMLLVSRLANSPEFSCGHVFGGSRINCIDFDKVMVLKEETIYKNSGFWGIAKIEIRKIYPDEGNISCNEDNYPDCGLITVMDKKVNTSPPSSNFVALCRKETSQKMIYDKCEMAILMLSTEDKRETT